MKLKLQHRLAQTADRKVAFENAVEEELRRRLQLTGQHGIVSSSGSDIDNDTADCAVIENESESTSVDVRTGTVVFANGEYVEIGASDLTFIAIDSAVSDAQLVRLEYGEVEDGDIETNPYLNFSARPKIRKKTPAEMVVVETVTAYNAQSSVVKNNSVVLGVCRYETGGALVIDNGRDTYSFSRPWFSPVDETHRSHVGSGAVSNTNPHGTSANDLSVGSYTMWQAMAGPPSAVLARPVSVGRVPGALCTETIPAGSFLTDATGLVTGHAGARYAALGFWPERLTRACLTSTPATEVAAWIPRGRNVLAVSDPVNFAAPVSLDVYYTKVDAGALPGSMLGANQLDMTQPAADELLVAGGSFLTDFSEPRVHFTDVGLIPMSFDIVVGSDGKVYKTPDVVYCNTRLDTIGATAVSLTSQPRSPSRLRVAISNYIPAMTEVRIQFTGTNELGVASSEQVVFTGPLPAPAVGYAEVVAQRVFTNTTFSSVTNMQVITRNGDGPNTTLTVFAEQLPESSTTADDLLLASVHWSGVEVSANYANGAGVALDRRIVSRGGPNRGLSPVGTFLLSGDMSESAVATSTFSGSNSWATIVEDFADPQWTYYPRPSESQPIGLPSNSLGARLLYESRTIPLVRTMVDPGTLFIRLLPRSIHDWPNLPQDVNIQLTLYKSPAATDVYTGNMAAASVSRPYPPHKVALALSSGTGTGAYYAAKVSLLSNSSGLPINELIQGYVLQLRSLV